MSSPIRRSKRGRSSSFWLSGRGDESPIDTMDSRRQA